MIVVLCSGFLKMQVVSHQFRMLIDAVMMDETRKVDDDKYGAKRTSFIAVTETHQDSMFL